MDTSSPRNGSYLVIAVGIVAVVSLITAIVSLTKANSISKELATVSGLTTRLDSIEASAKRATDDAKSAGNRVTGLATEIQRAVSNEFARVDTDVRRIEIQTRELASKLENGVRPAASSGGSSGSGGSGGGNAGPAPGTMTETGEYVVQAGDNFGKIGARFGVSAAEMQAANPDVQPNRIRVGQKLRVPKKQ